MSLLLLLFLAAFIFCCVDAMKGPEYYNPPALATHSSGEDFVGSMTCMECHADIYADHLQTAHYNTSAIANKDNIKGSFKKGSNTVELEDLEIELVKHKGAFYQQLKLKESSQKLAPEKIDIVVGSGVKGQSYLTLGRRALIFNYRHLIIHLLTIGSIAQDTPCND